MAKWQIWLACLSNLAVFTGGLMAQHRRLSADRITEVLSQAVHLILHETGTPSDADKGFHDTAHQLLARLATSDWQNIPDDETCFSESPYALVQWAPIVDELKQLDEEIVRNSIKFRWQEVRRELRRRLDVDALENSADGLET